MGAHTLHAYHTNTACAYPAHVLITGANRTDTPTAYPPTDIHHTRTEHTAQTHTHTLDAHTILCATGTALGLVTGGAEVGMGATLTGRGAAAAGVAAGSTETSRTGAATAAEDASPPSSTACLPGSCSTMEPHPFQTLHECGCSSYPIWLFPAMCFFAAATT